MMPKFVIFLAVLTLFSATLPLSAQTTETQVIQEEIDCEQVLNDIDTKVKLFRAKEPKHIETYQILWLKTATIASTANILGYDTEKLYKDLDELDSLIEDFTDNFELFISNLQQTKNYACLQNQNSYAVAYSKTTKSLSNLKDSAQEITYFYENILVKDILNLERIETDE